MHIHFDKQDRKEINVLLKERGIKKKDKVFNLINQGGTPEQVSTLIEDLTREVEEAKKPELTLLEEPQEFNVFGSEIIAKNAIDDMATIMRLPYTIKGAMMPDAHRVRENHVPVGGAVLAEDIVPNIVGSDIACSVFLTFTGMVVDNEWFDKNLKTLKYVLREHTYFGRAMNPNNVVSQYPFYTEGVEVESALGKQVWDTVRKTAPSQFGTSGDGNHFVEIGVVNVTKRNNQIVRGQKPQLAILSHFGSRAVGSTIAKAFGKYAESLYEMPKGMSDAPLSQSTPEGRDYLRLMEWAGEFAEHGHQWLHAWVVNQIDARAPLDFSWSHSIYSKHNFAWKTDQGYLHRKGATPAAMGEYGVIPATMGDQTKIVMGLGNESSISSSSHGAGRTHSRGRAIQEFGGDDTVEYLLKNHGVHLVGGGADEDPRAYKDIASVMMHQSDCVTEVGGFNPKVVRMADPRFRY